MRKLTTVMILLISLSAVKSDSNIKKDSDDYDNCIYLHPCAHDGDDLKKLSKPEYMTVMQCRIKRHMECIKTEIEKNK